jgi:hypothetical protein
MVADVEDGDVNHARQIAQQMLEELLQNAVHRVNKNNQKESASSANDNARQTPQQIYAWQHLYNRIKNEYTQEVQESKGEPEQINWNDIRNVMQDFTKEIIVAKKRKSK